MTDYGYIMAQCRKFHFTKWDESILMDCQSFLSNLTREEMINVCRSRFLDEKHPLKQTTFKVLFADKVGKREERIKNLPTDQLIEEFKYKKRGNVALIRGELRERYKANRDRAMVEMAFNASTKIGK